MKYSLLSLSKLLWVAVLLGAISFVQTSALSADKAPRKLKVQLVWATNTEQSPEKAHKELNETDAKALSKHFKWKNYFLVSNKEITTGPKTKMSSECELQIKEAAGSSLEVELWGKGKSVLKKTQKFTKGETLTIGGDAENDSAWFIIIKEM